MEQAVLGLVTLDLQREFLAIAGSVEQRLAQLPVGQDFVFLALVLDVIAAWNRTGNDRVLLAYSNSMMIWSTDRLSPTAAEIFLTLQSCSALRMFSIFMASMTASFSPAFTS